jgi:hypothetical protein
MRKLQELFQTQPGFGKSSFVSELWQVYQGLRICSRRLGKPCALAKTLATVHSHILSGKELGKFLPDKLRAMEHNLAL